MSLYTGNFVAAERLVLTGSTVQGPTAALLGTGLTGALLTVEGGPIRLWVHGEDPTTIIGHYVPEDGSYSVVGGGNVRALRMIAVDGAGGATVQISYGEGGATA